MSTYAIKSDKLVLPSGIDGFGYLLVEDGTFGGVSVDAPAGVRVIDRMGCWVAPGFVDTHIHGFGGHDVMEADPDVIAKISRALARKGTTSWLATTCTASVEEISAACVALGAARDPQVRGVFLEGPFFTLEHCGAQDPRFLADPSMDLLLRWHEESNGLVCKVGVAPERTGAIDFVAAATAAGFTVGMGHSSATYGQAAAAVLAGAKVVVHTFNGMDDMGHRDPGIVGCAMTSQGVYAELICDGIHVDPVACEALVRSKGWEHVVLVSDCLSCGGMPDGDYKLGDNPVSLHDGAAWLPGGTTLAGSALTLAVAVRNVVDWGIVTAEQAIRMASEVPARSLGMGSQCGSILPGRVADLTVLDANLDLVETYVAGNRV